MWSSAALCHSMDDPVVHDFDGGGGALRGSVGMFPELFIGGVRQGRALAYLIK